MKKIILILSSFSILSTSLLAQHSQGSWCGTEISQDWMEAFYQRDKSHLTNKSGNYPEVYIPIVYHIVGDDSGNGYFELQEIFRSHCELESLFDDADVNFYIKSINYINNSNYYNGNQTTGLFFQYNDRNVCNVFIVSSMSGVCGYSYVPFAWDDNNVGGGPNRGGIMLAQNCMEAGNTTYRHEMGHYLNLPHTFYGWEGQNPPGIGSNAPNTINGNAVERANGTNCYTSGDGFCDTPPDYLSDRWNCNFARIYTDPNGVQFTLDEKNFMSYSNDGCATYLKDEQLAEVNAAPANYRPYLLNDPVPPTPVIPAMSGFSPSAGTRNLNTNNLAISWDETPNATYYHLQATLFNFSNPTIDIVVEDTFYLINNVANNSAYEWRVRPINLLNVCSDFSTIRQFFTSSLSADIEITNSSCAENSDGSIEINLNQAGNYNYYWSCEDPLINSSIQNLNSNMISGLSPESYAVTVVATNGDTLYSQIAVIAPSDIEININQIGTGLSAAITGGSPPYSFVWDNGQETLSLSSLNDGNTYTIIVVDQNGCQKTATATYDATATSIRDVNNDVIGKIILAPNPSKSGASALIIPSNKAGELTYSITDLSGKVLSQEIVNVDKGANSYPLNFRNLSNGIYLVNVRFDNISKSAKLVVQNN